MYLNNILLSSEFLSTRLDHYVSFFLLFTDACSNTVFDHHRFDENFDVDLQELGKDWIPECSEGLKPYIDQRFSDLDQAFIFYKDP